MKKIMFCLCTIIAIAVLISALSVHAFADSYQVLALSTDADVFIYGIYASGAVVLDVPYSFGDCPFFTDECYVTYVNGLPFSGSSIPPSIPLGGASGYGNIYPLTNSYGDTVWDDVFQEEIYEDYDVTTHLGEVPEPGSWTFIVIGMLLTTAVIRKREFC
ncbi:hypothetical protein [Edaphobacter dinghuensis]|uniref:Secreted protein with PEP-CTERM sorting signal n=1 Tax=Edaphobacter dinghuensis TaxID=1560005 RepID=A0A917HKU1_9BACT|nr:hypothetical protein [Edaphobacter dinghuensis]GGG82208.1 hypothetical protein GCM10011585_27180 [Edaphobacter dinghuensis]